MYKEQVTELRSELERVKDESKQVKEKYYSQVNEVYIMCCLRFSWWWLGNLLTSGTWHYLVW